MKRAELTRQLGLLSPALSTTNLVEAYTWFMFTPKTIMAYNDSLGIIATTATGTGKSFAVAGATLLGLCENSTAEDIDFEIGTNSVIFQAGKSKFTLPSFGDGAFLFSPPKERFVVQVEINEGLLRGIETCLTTSSRDQAQPAIAGVCFNAGVSILNLFSCDGDAITRYRADAIPNGDGVFTAPNGFCDALLKIANETETKQGKLELNDNWAKATLNNGFTVYGRMIINDTPLDHAALIKKSMKGDTPFITLPLGLKEALARARVLADPESAKTTVAVDAGKLMLLTETHMGTVRDDLKAKGHDDVKALVHASLMHRSLDVCDEISIRENVTVYRQGKTVLQVVSNIGE